MYQQMFRNSVIINCQIWSADTRIDNKEFYFDKFDIFRNQNFTIHIQTNVHRRYIALMPYHTLIKLIQVNHKYFVLEDYIFFKWTFIKGTTIIKSQIYLL
jgi:hypothetical protein